MAQEQHNESHVAIQSMLASYLIRILLIISTGIELYTGRLSIVFLNILALGLSFLPLTIEKLFSLTLPSKFELIFLIYLLLMPKPIENR